MKHILATVITLSFFLTGMTSTSGQAGPLPARDQRDWSLDDAYRAKTDTRETLSLNGVWQISLQNGNGLFKQKKLSKKEQILQKLKGIKLAVIPQKTFATETIWQDIRVPGLWYDAAWWSISQYESQLGRDKFTKPLVRVNNLVKWAGAPLKDFYFAWYRREFTLPANWKTGETFLNFDKFNREAWIFVNSTYVGRQLESETRDIPLPADAAPGNTVHLDILVSAFVAGDDTAFHGGDQIFKKKKKSLLRGISGDTWLIRRPAKRYIKDTYITTSVREKSLTLAVQFSTPPKGLLKGVIRNNGESKTVKAFTLPVADGQKRNDNTYQFTIPWQKPTYWNPDKPHLYELFLTWETTDHQIIDTALPIRFGFREIWIAGRNYYLNGHPVHLRISSVYAMPKPEATAIFKDIKKLGYNSVETLMLNVRDNHAIDGFLNAADEEGIMVLFQLPGINKLAHTWHDANTRKKWTTTIKSLLAKARQHPSVIQWGMNFNFLGYPLDQDPHRLGMDYYPPKTSSSGRKWLVAKNSEEIVQQLDPTRPIYHHAGGNFGQTHTSNMYLNFSPLQEKSEWPSLWAEKGVKPFLPIELGNPCGLSYHHNRQSIGHGNNWKSEPLYAEYAARVLGPAAYDMADPESVKKMLNFTVIKNALGDSSDHYKGMFNYYYSGMRRKALADFINTQAVLGEFYKNWRTYGVSGFDPWTNNYSLRNNLKKYTGNVKTYNSLKTPGYKTLFEYAPTFSGKTALYRKHQEWLNPELLYICGSQHEFTDKGHTFRSGANVKKGFAWINDTFSPLNASIRVAVVCGTGNTIFQQTYELQATPGQIQIQDFSFKAPGVDKKTSYTIKLYKNNDLKDTFAIEVFPEKAASKPALQRQIYVIDSKGKTSQHLKQLTIPFKSYDGETLSANTILIIGRESLQAAEHYAKAIKDAVEKGMNLIVFEQVANDLKNAFGFKAFAASAREAFLSQDTHPVLAGISQEDLINWPGKSTLLEEYPKPQKDQSPKHIWKFGNKQTVASVVIEKPHKRAFRSLLHEGFDLNYTPLLEEICGQGKILFCQLDLSGRTKDNPAGDLLLQNIIRYMDSKKSSKPNSFYYIGGQTGEQILDMLDINYQKTTDISDLPKHAILIVGSSKNYSSKQLQILKTLGKKTEPDVLDLVPEKLKSFAEAGGTIVILAANNLKKTAKTFGIEIPETRMNDYKFRPIVIDGITLGSGGGDWYWKDKLDIMLPTKNFPIRADKIGNGRLVICQINPLYYNQSDMYQRRSRAQAKMTRILSTVFTNLGASFNTSSLDRFIEGGEVKDIDLTGKWNFRIDLKNKGLQQQWHEQAWNKVEKKIDVPGTWEAQGVTTPNPAVNGKLPYDGYAWYQKEILIPEAYKGKQLYLEIGTCDDFDWAYFNGVEIGKTGKEHPKYYDTKRYYPIPAESIKYGENNLMAIRIFDNYLQGGIPKGPVRLTFKKERDTPYLKHVYNFDPYNYYRW